MALTASRWRTLGPYRWRTAIRWQSFLIGVERDFAMDAWVLCLGPFAVRWHRQGR